MAQITFTIPDTFIPRIAAFTKGKIRDYIKKITIRNERRLAHQLATESIQDEIDGIDIT